MTLNVINELVNHKRRNRPSLKLKTTAGNTVVEDPKVVVNEFSNFFVNIGEEMAGSI